MALEVEDAFPSFSTERIRSKVQLREGPVTQRRLDYNAPLLSVRHLTDAGGDAKSKVWKLSGELSKEPLRVPGAVPFTWEHTPGRPKQPESPPQMPSSPSPPSTPSPPSARRASPASPPPPPPLRPLFVRSNSSTLFAPPPPPPPPPPPLPPISPLPILTRRTVLHAKRPLSSSASPPPPPPPPPPPSYRPTFSRVHKQISTVPVSQHLPDHERMGAFRLVDPTDGFLRVLRARRLKAEPEEFLTAEVAEEVAEVSHKAVEEEGSIAEVGSSKDNSSCAAVDAIAERFLVEHPDAATEEEASVERQDDKAPQEDDQASLDTVNSVSLTYDRSKHDAEQGEDAITDASNPCSTSASKEDVAYISVLQVACADEASEEMQKCESKIPDGFATEYGPSPTHEKGGFVWALISPSTDPREVQIEAGHKQSLIKKQPNRRRTSSIAILDSCRVETLQMIKSALLQFCRKAAAASMRTLAKAKQKVSTSRCTSSSLDVVVHPNANRSFHENRSNWKQEAVVREENTIVQETQQQAFVSIPHSHPITPPRSSSDIVQESSESNLYDEINADAKRGCTPVSSPKPLSQKSPLYETNEAEEKDIMPSSPHLTWNGKRGCNSISSPKLSSESSPSLETNEAEKNDILSSPLHQSPNGQGSPGLQPPEQEERLEVRSRASSARHAYAKSLGGDEPNEFYDASSRFGSRGSTPSRIHSNRSMSKDWSIPDDFLDATSSPFETPRTSVSDFRYTISNAELTDFSSSTTSKMGSSTRPTSKLSKRVGKSLWVDTREINAVGKVDAVINSELKGFTSGELYPTSTESDQVLNKKELNGTRRKYLSGDQASTSTSDARRQYKRDIASRRSNGKSIAVTPVFPSKCQKNRSIASASGLPQQISTVDMTEMGWPLGISGYPPLKINTKVKEEKKERGATKGESNLVLPLPPLPPSPAGGSWLRKALSTNTQKQAPSGLTSFHAAANKKVESSSSPGSKWEDIVKGSHVQPGHLRFSEELHHHTPSNSTSNKYYVS